ncbi:hypothetical protein TGAMA5MH_07680 [Trichoderma gamsii]|uniref:AGC-kinase C-terminal domain-containing protein n=1 Tax=Trichoderma gamsii TaxID=398673 RepID=A0A2K0T4A1_9HYPO|nr:hypothetical protein TGAMA5MH_07680 [Trichoderma gamsii]
MLSHLRFHRRGPSTPTSPAPDQPSPSSQSPLNADSPSPLDAQLAASASASASAASAPASTSLPPTLPPIARVTSNELNLNPPQVEERRDVEKPAQPPVSRPSQSQRPGYSSTGSGFIGGVALRNYQRNVAAQQAGDSSKFDGHAQASHQAPALKNVDLTTRPSPQTLGGSKATASHSTSSVPYSSSSNQRLPGSTPSSSVFNIEPQKGKKGLPFLKNPMSTLLLRRKNNQSLQNALPPPLSGRSDEFTYDPRIKGTRVHDFSAPRRKTNAPVNDTVAIRSASLANIALESGVGPRDGVDSRGPVVLDGQQQRRMLSSASDPARPESGSTNSHTIAQSSSVSSVRTGSSTAEQAFPYDDYMIMKKNDSALQANPSITSQIPVQDNDGSKTVAGSIRTTRSRNVSLSSIPRHMKSTSSRFSFDMIGAAKQEKLLEERHRQRELEQKAAQTETRDSRFDDFDEDSFDYDAMMDDDGLEERIPGVNADYDEEEEPYFDDQYYEQEAQYVEDELDPDNDQENFAGFAFQRSDATSSLATPQSGEMMATPRDFGGEDIGYSLTKDAIGLPMDSLLPESGLAPNQETDAEVSGLGIQGVNVDTPFQTPGDLSSYPMAVPPAAGMRRSISEDELYFDGGMSGFGGVFAEDLAGGPIEDDVPFDESLFDNDDTDQFGRPLAGAFAAAKSLREKKSKQGTPDQGTPGQKTPDQETAEQESEVPEVPSQISESLHTSQPETQTPSSIDEEQLDENAVRGTDADADADPLSDLPPISETDIVAPQPTTYNTNPIVAYQAALAAAAQKAAEAGMFERAMPQSPTDADTQGQQPSADFDELDATYHDDPYDDYGYAYDDMDDFEMDDDAIIAEANASALANDADGWYGQEFGFYATPIGNNAAANLESYGYAAGGFFGPKGASNLNRSVSGRVISREPNLTPITERSEYSNRNSLMSLGMPPISGTPIVQSPGLAQLAMMADRGDEMNLSALLRLRSRAWGGSQASLASSNGGSPRSERGDIPGSPRGPSFVTGFPPSMGHTRKNSAFSVVSRESDTGSAPASPTLTMPMSFLNHRSSTDPTFVNREADLPAGWGAASASPVQMGSNFFQEGVSPLSDPQCPPPTFTMPCGVHPHAMSNNQEASSPEKGHRRQKGSTDSVSYMMEEESGETRWVMERRRTGEFGQVEILEREVVEGGRI